MRKYRNTKTGRIVTTTCKVSGEQWEELVAEQAPAQTDEDENVAEQAPAQTDEDENVAEQAPAKSAKKDKK